MNEFLIHESWLHIIPPSFDKWINYKPTWKIIFIQFLESLWRVSRRISICFQFQTNFKVHTIFKPINSEFHSRKVSKNFATLRKYCENFIDPSFFLYLCYEFLLVDVKQNFMTSKIQLNSVLTNDWFLFYEFYRFPLSAFYAFRSFFSEPFIFI